MTRNPDVSILIPVKNGQIWLKQTLQSIFSQKTKISFEVVIVDSESNDASVAIIREFDIRLYQIDVSEFSHSKTRNYLFSLAKSQKYCIFMNQDALPLSELWLETLYNKMEKYPDLVALSVCELEEKNAKKFSGLAPHVFSGLDQIHDHFILPHTERKFCTSTRKRRRLYPFSTVCAIFRSEHFRQNQFNTSIDWGEDLEWAVRNSELGYTLGITADKNCRVKHKAINYEHEREAILAKGEKLNRILFSRYCVRDFVGRIFSFFKQSAK